MSTVNRELRYFGRVLAGQCHELANALNIAHELCGLHEDTLPRAREGDARAVEKLGSLAQRFAAQIARSNAIVRSLGHFAHSVDEGPLECDPREIVERSVFFAACQARRRQTELRTILPEGVIGFVQGSQFQLQQAAHAGIELLLEGVTEGRRITIRLAPDPAGAVITLESADPLPGNDVAAGRLAEIDALLHASGCEVRLTASNPGRIVFFLPYSHGDSTVLEPHTLAALAEVPDVD